MTPAPPLHTARLVLRPHRPDDADALLRIYGDPGVARFLLEEPWTAEVARRTVAERLPRTGLDSDARALALVVEHEDEVIGDVAVWHPGDDPSTAEIGWVFGTSAGGRGLATEAAAAVLKVVFTDGGLHRVEAQMDARNTASARLCERLGMTREAHLRSNWWSKGEWTDTVVYGLVAGEPVGGPDAAGVAGHGGEPVGGRDGAGVGERGGEPVSGRDAAGVGGRGDQEFAERGSRLVGERGSETVGGRDGEPVGSRDATRVAGSSGEPVGGRGDQKFAGLGGAEVAGVVPDLLVPDLAEATAFWCDLLGFREESLGLDWVTRLVAPGARVQLLTRDATAPEPPVVTVQVRDVDTAHERVRRAGHEIVHPLTTEPWGVRRFFVRAPGGHVLNVAQHRE